jgi:transglutaminase/protease-like cytokinesis protein 3
MTNNVAYDIKAYKTNKFTEQTAELVLKSKLGVCEGYANLYQALCHEVGIKCEKVLGISKGHGYYPGCEIPTEPSHAWNIIELDDKK